MPKKQKNIYPITLCLILILAITNTTKAKEIYKIETIVLDPGHGGIDSGTIGPNSKEKDIALQLTLKLGQLIQSKYKNIKVIYTRKTDKTLPIHKRATIANKAKANLLISIHCNGHKDQRANGAEIITMSINQYKKRISNLARRENSVITMERNYKKIYKNFNPNSQEFKILGSLRDMANNQHSIKIAQSIKTQLETKTKIKTRGIKQETLILLYITNAPSIFIEVGFITNPKEEQYIKSETGQKQIALAILQGIINYKNKIEKT